jgi:hypothetical protein
VELRAQIQPLLLEVQVRPAESNAGAEVSLRTTAMYASPRRKLTVLLHN